MSLYGALYSGVSGLTAQSSAMGAISDNITNVSTIGYKNTSVNFQTLVTKQTSSTFYSAGGVQSRPRQAVDVQGLLQASTSQTDLAISGGGFFVVNEAGLPTGSDPYFYTRAGSFKQDSEGFLANSGGYYLQGWPTDAAGNVVPANDALTQTNLNVISNDYLETINLSRVSGSAASTTEIGIGANLPTGMAAGTQYSTDVQFYDSLGSARSMSIGYVKSAVENQWGIDVPPPQGTTVLTAYDGSGNVYDSTGRLDFLSIPADGSRITIDGVSYEFDTDGAFGGAAAGAQAQSDTFLVGGAAAEAGDEFTMDFTINGVTTQITTGVLGAATTSIDLATALVTAINADPVLGPKVTASNVGGTSATITLVSDIPGLPYTVTADDVTGDVVGTDTTITGPTVVTANITPTTVQVDISASTTVGATTQALVNAVNGFDSDFNTTNNRIDTHPDDSTMVLFRDDGTGSIVVDPLGLLDANGDAATDQTTSFNAQQIHADYTNHGQFTFSANPIDGDNEIFTVNGTDYEFGVLGAGDVSVTIGVDLAATMANLKTAIETNDPSYAPGSIVLGEAGKTTYTTLGNDTIIIPSISAAGISASVDATGMSVATVTAIGATTTGTDTYDITTAGGIIFSSKGVPTAYNVSKLEILGMTNGAANMDDNTANSPMLTLDFGVIGGNEGMTQFGSEFSATSITQNGSRFGNFSGVSFSPDGLVTALFDNGDTRPIYRVPIATFTNPNGMDGRTGNVWNASQASGDYTLRTAGNGPAGVVTQASLESSTVDIGSEFTQMIVVQRAYSASTKIISTADQMLEELMRVKR